MRLPGLTCGPHHWLTHLHPHSLRSLLRKQSKLPHIIWWLKQWETRTTVVVATNNESIFLGVKTKWSWWIREWKGISKWRQTCKDGKSFANWKERWFIGSFFPPILNTESGNKILPCSWRPESPQMFPVVLDWCDNAENTPTRQPQGQLQAWELPLQTN